MNAKLNNLVAERNTATGESKIEAMNPVIINEKDETST
jgi:hypothetical protein